MYMLNGWWFLSSGGSYPPAFVVEMPMNDIFGGSEHENENKAMINNNTKE